MNKKGFVLLETIVVLIVTVVSMLGLYLTYSFVFKNLNQEKYYDNINDVYKLKIFYDILKPSINTNDIGYTTAISTNCEINLFNTANCNELMTKLGFEYFIYTDEDMDRILSSFDPSSTLKVTDIEYMKKLEHNYSYLIGVLKRNDKYYYVSLKAGEIR